MAKKQPTFWIIGGGLGLLGLGMALALGGGGGGPAVKAGEIKPTPKPDAPPKDDAIVFDPKPGSALVPTIVPDLFSDLPVLDMRALAPAEYIRHKRTLADIRAVVLHQTGFEWKRDNPLWPKVRAHFVVHRDGAIQCNFDPIQQMRVGSNHANPFSITIEHEGNFPSSAGKWWEGQKFGESKLHESPAQVAAARKLLAALKSKYPLTHVYAHRQWDANKSNCCGPDIWREVGEWAKAQLGLKDGGPGWHYDGGLEIPASWRGEFA